jgi:ABC-type antimicrobial peptide transport system permease subunit
MINIFQASRLTLKKIKFNKGKSLFVIIPIALMFGIIVFADSEALNLINVAHNSIFSPIQSQNEIIELNKTTSGRDMFSDTASTNYSTTDNSMISTISNVEKVSLIKELPIDIIKTNDLFTDKTVEISSLAGLDSEYAQLYTSQSFEYTDNADIPIILNANDFNEIFVDWGGKTEISVDYTSTASPEDSATLATQSPVKSKAITYSRDELIGKKITVTFGGLDTISNVKQESTTTGYKYTQKTETELATEIEARKTAITKYWDYTKISTPITYTFVVAGISEGTDKTKAYVPEAFAEKLMKEYLAISVNARNTTAIASAEQNATYTGLVYDGVTLGTDSTSTLFAGLRNQINTQITGQINNINSQIDSQNAAINSANATNRANFEAMKNFTPGQGGPGSGGTRPSGSFRSITSSVSKISTSSIKVSYSGMATSYNIPGLVYSKDRTTSEITGEYSGFATTAVNVPLPSKTILIKINELTNRDQIITDLNAKGYNYQDYSQYKQFDKLESYMYLILNIGSIVFMVVTALFILINMAKFVSEGKKEIGIFRAIGATKGDIRLIFILQTLAYIVISLITGAIIGVVSMLAASAIMVTSAQSFITSAIGTTIVLSQEISQSNFLSLDYKMILIYSGVLLLVTLIVSLIPSSQAAKVSPVEAIRNS